VRTLAYFPFEEAHAEEGSILAWILVLSYLAVGIVASFVNLFLGIALAVIGLHGSALARYLVTR
jgi:hypothetical protein